MNKQAYMDGYMCKTALVSMPVPVSQWLLRSEKPKTDPQQDVQQLPHEKMFTSPLAKKIAPHIGENSFLADPYTPESQPWVMNKLKDWSPEWVKDKFKASAIERMKRDPAYRAHMYRTNLEARRGIQAEAWKKIKGSGMMLGGGALMGAAAVGIPWILSSLMRNKQQSPAGSPQVQAFKQQLLAMQQQRLQQAPRPMRLGLVDKGRV
jgi:hypothetical protein